MGFSSTSLHLYPSQSLHLYKTIHEIQPRSLIPPRRQSPRLSRVLSRTSINGCDSLMMRSSRKMSIGESLQRKRVFFRFQTRASELESRFPEEEDGQIEVGRGNGGKIAVGSAITVVLAVVNRVLYKLALVPMKEYPFFMAQVTTFGYVAFYFSFLYMRYRAGIVTKEMLGIPKKLFVAIGFLEALGVAAGMAAGAMLPGPAIPILNQTFLVWQLIFSVWVLGREYSFSQTFGCILVAAGVVVAVSSGANDAGTLSEVEFLWPALMIASSAFQAGASILKEFVFIDASKRLKGKPLDLFVVNSFGSGYQALFVLLLLPLLSSLKGIPFAELPSYLRSGAGCFLNIGANTTGKFSSFRTAIYLQYTNRTAHNLEQNNLNWDVKLSSGCEGAPLLPLLYIAVNMAFNISVLYLVKISSAVVSSLAATLAVPLSIYVLTLPLPYIPQGDGLSPFFVIGSAILVLGLALYNIPQPANKGSKSD
ncbi:protein CLT2, chloroplastic [Cinnamomum micranthum f. kanehirae]|uniref:Protein CLT2, chloroplastic n=1 Tax=Cinnamomum micranthum f. kanehirae TaxID=337451 RepID=A0A443NFL0_9MAGN|nr:protein CLT2, chloroplastic [Cinnamomum micranthum f. kanehirae]